MLDTYLKEYLNDTKNPEINFKLGLEYENMQHYAAAISHYIRCANYNNDKILQYKAFIRAILCYNILGDRNHTVKRMLQCAIAFMPERKEAYFFISQLHERLKEWMDAYSYASIGYNLPDQPSIGIKEYLEDGLHFEKAVTAWWIGEYEESRELTHQLLAKIDTLDEGHKVAVIKNISSIGYPRSEYEYTNKKFNNLRFSFPGAEKIEKNFSQAYQDLFILAVLNGKQNGYYFEIGSGDPFLTSNTALLETVFDWKGLSIDINQGDVRNFSEQRKNKVVCCDATTVDYESLLKDSPEVIDYLQVDCEPPETTLYVLNRIPFKKHKFKIITFEHDDYRSYSQKIKQKSRELLTKYGYKLLVSDIAFHEGCNFEDWWIHPEFIDEETIKKFQDISEKTKQVKDYMFL